VGGIPPGTGGGEKKRETDGDMKRGFWGTGTGKEKGGQGEGGTRSGASIVGSKIHRFIEGQHSKTETGRKNCGIV